MRLFVYEHATGGGWAKGELPASLSLEGRSMLSAIVGDLARIPGIEVTTQLDTRVSGRGIEGAAITRVDTTDDAWEKFERHATEADGVLVVAPELDGCLRQLALRVEKTKARWLGSSPQAIAMASDKLTLPALLRDAGIAGVEASLFTAECATQLPVTMSGPCIIKPRFGAGSTGVQGYRDGRIAATEMANAQRPTVPGERIISPWLPGAPVSVLAVVGPQGIVTFPPAAQHLTEDGRFEYLGGSAPVTEPERTRAEKLAHRAIAAIPGLYGFVGVDLLLYSTVDRVVEINARLTTSYIGLRALTRSNLAAVWLDAVHGKPPPRLRWRRQPVRFFPDGRVEAYCSAPKLL